MRHHGIGTRARDAHVLTHLRRRTGLCVFIDFTVAVGVEYPGRPALRLGGVRRFIPYLGVDPARDRSGAREPKRIIGVVAELRMVSTKASINEAVLHRLRIEHRYLAARDLKRECFRRRMLRALLAKGWIISPSHRRRKPHAALLVEHAIVIVGTLAPDFLIAPVGRGRRRFRHRGAMKGRSKRLRCVRIGDRHLEERHLVRLRVEDRNIVARIFGRTVEWAVGIDGRRSEEHTSELQSLRHLVCRLLLEKKKTTKKANKKTYTTKTPKTNAPAKEYNEYDRHTTKDNSRQHLAPTTSTKHQYKQNHRDLLK